MVDRPPLSEVNPYVAVQSAPLAQAREPSGALPGEATPYHHFLRTPRHRWWKSLVMVVGVIVAYLVLSVVLTIVALVVDAATGQSTALMDGSVEMTPLLFAMTILGLALLIPVSMLLQWALWGQRPRWLSSVEGGLRWGLMGRFALVLVPIYLLYVGIAMFGSGWRPGPEVNPNWLVFTILIVVLIPFQSAGEEYAVRGALTRAIAAVIPPRIVALVVSTLVSAAIFTAGHPNLEPWRLTGYLVIASGFSVLVWRTGGLEAAILGHALNNVLGMIPTALWGDMSAALLGADGAGSNAADVGMLLLLALVSWGAVELVFRRSKYSRTGPPAGATELR